MVSTFPRCDYELCFVNLKNFHLSHLKLVHKEKIQITNDRHNLRKLPSSLMTMVKPSNQILGLVEFIKP